MTTLIPTQSSIIKTDPKALKITPWDFLFLRFLLTEGFSVIFHKKPLGLSFTKPYMLRQFSKGNMGISDEGMLYYKKTSVVKSIVTFRYIGKFRHIKPCYFGKKNFHQSTDNTFISETFAVPLFNSLTEHNFKFRTFRKVKMR